MVEFLKNSFSIFVVIYILGVALIPLAIANIGRLLQKPSKRRRSAQGLDNRVFVSPSRTLKRQKRHVTFETVSFLLLAIALPYLLIYIIQHIPDGLLDKVSPTETSRAAEIEKIHLSFAALIIWTLASGTTVAKGFLGGIAFRAISTMNRSLQIGDRATIGEHHGVVEEIGIFSTRLHTFDGDTVSIPTSSLLYTDLTSTNGGERASLCNIEFYLDPRGTGDDFQQAEDLLWETIQSSPYFDFNEPLKILYAQTETSVVVRAKAFVHSTLDEFEFRSEVTKKVLCGLKGRGIEITALNCDLNTGHHDKGGAA